jgi:hypothetical protein
MKFPSFPRHACAVVLCAIMATFALGQPAPRRIPPNMFPVKPNASHRAPVAANLRIATAKFFSYALPEGWSLGEDGQFALTLVAPDKKAFTVMVGNAGFPRNYSPAQFVHEKLMAMRPENLRIGQPRQGAPAPGFAQAYVFDLSYSTRGVANRGVAKCNVNLSYDAAVMAMTAAISEAGQWAGYSTWLPLVADQVSATNGAAFGVRGVMAQNLRNSTAYAAAAREYRDWSQRNWQQVTDDRNASVDRRNAQFRDNIGGVQPYNNPYDTRTPIEMPTTYKYYWVDRQGNYLGSNDPSANPNTGSTGDWKQMQPRKP